MAASEKDVVPDLEPKLASLVALALDQRDRVPRR
jgi:hypothetical protein